MQYGDQTGNGGPDTGTDPRGLEETEGPGVGKWMDGPSGALSTTDSAER